MSTIDTWGWVQKKMLVMGACVAKSVPASDLHVKY